MGAEFGLRDPKIYASILAPSASSVYWVRLGCSLAGRKEAVSARWVLRADRKRPGWGEGDSSQVHVF